LSRVRSRSRAGEASRGDSVAPVGRVAEKANDIFC
jgi:hypothetical protein